MPTPDLQADNLVLLAKNVRQNILQLVHRTQSPHIGGSFSIVEILVSLYFQFLHVSPLDPENPERDRFILSKGHACPALYAVLAARGFLKPEDLQGFAVDGGTLEQHPRRDVQKGIEVSTGSLGHGLSIAAGMALAARHDGKKHRVIALVSDGELNEGSVWEAIMFAAHHRLDNLTAIVDLNKIQALGYTREIINLEPLSRKWVSFGWEVREINGHDLTEISRALGDLPFSPGKPSVIIAQTVKGKGVSFMEDQLLWHYRAPNAEEFQKALRELS